MQSSDAGVVGRVVSVDSSVVRVALDNASTGFTKVGPTGIATVGVVNSYVTIPAGSQRVVAIVTGVSIAGSQTTLDPKDPFPSDVSSGSYELTTTVVGRFENDSFKSGLTGYPSLHAPVRTATPEEVRQIFLPNSTAGIRIGASAVANEQDVYLDANLLLGHHCAIVGSTGSGKSCTVVAVIDALLDLDIPNGHIVIFDINGEYATAFAEATHRGKQARTVVLGPRPGLEDGLILPHWFMNNEEHLALFRASEGAQAPILQRAVADARTTSAGKGRDVMRLENMTTTIGIVEGDFSAKNAQQPALRQLQGLRGMVSAQAGDVTSPVQALWKDISDAVVNALDVQLATDPLQDTQWQALSVLQRDVLQRLFETLRALAGQALDGLGMGSAVVSPDFDAPVYYSLKALCDLFLPERVRREGGNDNRISGYVATLQMRLNRLLADGRYDFMTRVEDHSDPVGAYLRLLMGESPSGPEPDGPWPGQDVWTDHMSDTADGPSVVIFDLSLIASDVLANVTALLGRLIFDFATRSVPRADQPLLLVLEEAHRFVPAQTDVVGARSAQVFERIAKEGRKFGVSLLLASQRPSELSETVIAQCGTVIAHRLTHEADQALLRHATSFSSRELLNQLPGLAQQHALITGVATGVPVAVKVRKVEDPPLSRDPDFIERWSGDSTRSELLQLIDRVAKDWQRL